MLPPILSEILCSINARQDRFAFSVIWKLNDDGIVKETKITKTIIRSCAKLAYGDAQTVIDTENKDGSPSQAGIDQIASKNPEASPSAIAQDILYLHRIAQRLRAARFASGAIKLNRVKLHFELDNTVTPPLPTSFQHYEQKTSNELVEEYMLLANQSVAAFILETFPKHSLLRRHPAPQERKLKEFIQLMDSLKIPIDATSGSTMLASIAKQPAENKMLLEDLMTRTMQPAVYFCTGDVAKPEDMHHYALNVPVYTHFTSPIRRYPDVIVHRLIAAALDAAKTQRNSKGAPNTQPRLILSGEALSGICKNSNNRKLMARKAQERSQTVNLCIWLQSHPFTDDDTRVLEIGERYVKLYSHKIGKSVRVPVSALEDKGVTSKWSAETKTLHLSWKSADGVDKSRSLTWFQTLSVQFSASTQVPMDLEAIVQLDGLSIHLGELQSE
jgi:DIS3-like exonuclease 2